VPPDTVQVAGNLSYYWGLNGGFPLGNRPEHMLGHLGCSQGHNSLTTSELPKLYGVALQN
jgi:hypothetical protein